METTSLVKSSNIPMCHLNVINIPHGVILISSHRTGRVNKCLVNMNVPRCVCAQARHAYIPQYKKKLYLPIWRIFGNAYYLLIVITYHRILTIWKSMLLNGYKNRFLQHVLDITSWKKTNQFKKREQVKCMPYSMNKTEYFVALLYKSETPK